MGSHCRESKKKKKKQCAMSKFGILLSFALFGFFLSQVDGKASKHFLIETDDAKSSMPETDGTDYGGASPGGGSNNTPISATDPKNPPTEIDHCWVCTMDGCHPGAKIGPAVDFTTAT